MVKLEKSDPVQRWNIRDWSIHTSRLISCIHTDWIMPNRFILNCWQWIGTHLIFSIVFIRWMISGLDHFNYSQDRFKVPLQSDENENNATAMNDFSRLQSDALCKQARHFRSSIPTTMNCSIPNHVVKRSECLTLCKEFSRLYPIPDKYQLVVLPEPTTRKNSIIK